MGWAVAAAGAFTLMGAVLDWNWFMEHPRAWLFVKLLGRRGARVFYALLGLAFLVTGVLLGLGLLSLGEPEPQAR